LPVHIFFRFCGLLRRRHRAGGVFEDVFLTAVLITACRMARISRSEDGFVRPEISCPPDRAGTGSAIKSPLWKYHFLRAFGVESRKKKKNGILSILVLDFRVILVDNTF
jgi:hypothetical protein